jgi:hypothetical protein
MIVEEMLKVIRNGTAVGWQHINILGKYDFNQLVDNQMYCFDLAHILAWKLKPAA